MADSSPDFAFPTKVIAQSEKELTAALKKHDNQAVVVSLINDCIAENIIDNSKAGRIVEKIDSVIALSADDHSLTAMLNMLNARLLTEIYRDRKYVFDQRNLPDTPLPDDLFLWSGKQIRGKIMDYIEASLSDIPALTACPINSYKSAISIDADDIILYPTLFDFIANRAINSINSISNNFTLYNSRYLLPGKEFVSAKINPASIYAAKVLNIYALLLECHVNDTPAYIAADLSRLQYVRDHLFYQDTNQYDYFATVRQLYDEYSDNEYSALALIPLSREIKSSGMTKKEWVKTLDAYISRFPDGSLTDTVKRLREIATCKEMLLSFPSIVPPATPVDFTVTFNNVNSASISIYNVTDIPDNKRREAYKSLIPIAILPVGSTGEIPFTIQKTVSFSFPGYGVFLIVPSFEGSQNDWPQTVTVSSLAAFVRTVRNDNSILVLDRVSGKGVSGVAVSEFSDERDSKITQLIGSTDSEGILNYKSVTDKYSSVIAFSKGLDSYSDKLRVYSSRDNNQPGLEGEIFTSLPLYHPGDSLQWGAIIYETKTSSYHVAPGQKLEISLLDANRQPVDKISASTDDYGRVDGSFLIPADRLTGYFFLDIKHNNRRICCSNIMVSDYVAPQFRIMTEAVENDYPEKGDVTIRGNVATYSGFNLAGVPVSINVCAYPPFYFRGFNGSADDVFFSSTIDTDAQGNFNLVISRRVLDDAPLPDGLFAVNISATSTNGETESASLSFMRSTVYRLNASLKTRVVEAPDSLQVAVNVLDYKDEKVDVPVVYSIATDNDTVINKSPLPTNNLIPVETLPSGQYRIIFATADAKLAEPVSQDFILYRLSDSGTPVKDVMLWTPDGQNINLDHSRKLKWRYAVNENLILHYCVATENSIIETGKFAGKPGYNLWEYVLPSQYEKCEISIVAFKNNKCYESQLSLSAPPAVSPIRIKTESFRDRVTPGSGETWKFYVVDDDNSPRQAAVMMRMYNAALDALQNDLWYLPRFFKTVPLSVQAQRSYDAYSSAIINCPNNIPYRDFTSLEFNTGGYSLYAGAPVMLRMSKAAYTSAGAADLNVVREHTDEVMVEEAMDMVADAGNSAGGAFESAADTEVEDGSNDAAERFQYRDAEVAGAFFFPMLRTDEEGHLTVTFSVPDANTTWKVNTLAFTKALDSSIFNASVMASKPVMVSPQVPAFVRLGDTVDIKALVMNMTDSAAIIDTEIEIFNPVDNSIIASSRATDTVSGKQSKTVSCSFKVDITGNAICYRVKSSTDLYADGEASLVPVLPSVAPVIESTTFYLTPGQENIEVPVTVAGKNPSVTLQYTENPAWYVAAALPGLITNESSTAVQAATVIHSAAIATGLMRDNPMIETGLREWLESNRSDSTYLSLLDRNPDLKIMLLEATPWVLDARSDTERMTRLALLFDREEIDRVLDVNISFLNTLANPDGGFKWMGQSPVSSEWATACVLKLFGQLNNLGYLPEKAVLKNLIKNGLSYMDNLVASRLDKYPETTFMSYTMITSLFPDYVVPEKSKRAIDITLESISSGWKAASVSQKAAYALLMHRFGRSTEAKKILESIFDFALSSPESGMWWPAIGQSGYLWHENSVAATAGILEAVDAIMPGSDNAEKIRQWIILQKQATDWRDPLSTSNVIAAVLKSSARLLETSGDVKITVGDSEVVPSSVEKVSGYFRADLSPYVSEDMTVKISRHDARQASWGSVINQYEADMNDIAASSIEGLSVTKRILRYTAGGVEETSDLKVGDKVSVQLTVISDRDIDYVAIDDLRGACFLPVEQLPRPVVSQGLYFYLEQRRDCTRIFVDRLRRGKYILSYDLYVTNSGTYSSGMTTLQSQYAPELTAHSSSKTLTVRAD